VLAQALEVGVFGQPSEVAVAENEGFFEGCGGEIDFAVKGVAAGEVVKDDGIAGLDLGELFIYVEAVAEAAALGVVVAEELQGFDVLGLAAEQSFQEADFDVQIPCLFSRKLLTASTAFSRHTTVEIFGISTEKSNAKGQDSWELRVERPSATAHYGTETTGTETDMGRAETAVEGNHEIREKHERGNAKTERKPRSEG
jgi:hypothetical protein